MIIENKHVEQYGSRKEVAENCDAGAGAADLHQLKEKEPSKLASADGDDSRENFDITSTFEMYPEWLRKGPWSPLACLYFISYLGALVWTFPAASELSVTTQTETPSASLSWFRAACAIWGTGFCVYMVRCGYGWAFSSYTVWSWVLSTCYFASVAVRDLSSGRLAELAADVATTVRFPALVQVSVTVAVWWLVLFPMILSMTPAKYKAKFVKFNFGFFMINIHFAVFPAVLADLFLCKTALTPFDLWASFAAAIVYIAWYLSFMDRNGLHMYIFLSPRTHFSPLVYSTILALYAACYAGYNQAVGGDTMIAGFDTAWLLPCLPGWALAA